MPKRYASTGSSILQTSPLIRQLLKSDLAIERKRGEIRFPRKINSEEDLSKPHPLTWGVQLNRL